MATRLKDLKVTKVDFVDAGANPNANVMLYKNKSGVPGDSGRAVGDPGNGGEAQGIPEGQEAQRPGGILKRFIAAIGKAVGLGPEEIDATVEEIEKGNADTFDAKMKERSLRRIGDEIWDLCYALQESLCSIIFDDDADDKQGLMEESVGQFSSAMAQAISKWVSGNTSGIIKRSAGPATEEEVQFMQYSMDRLEKMMDRTANGADDTGTQGSMGSDSGEKGETMIDKSLMTAAERAFYEEIEKRYSISPGDVEKSGAKEDTEEQGDDDGKKKKGKEEDPDVKKAVPAGDPVPEDIYAGLHPLVAAELQRLQKRADEADEKELAEVAKKYGIIGKRPEELVPVLKSLRSAGGTAYTDMLSILDAFVEAVNKSALFTEIGKSGGYGGGEPDAWAKIEKKADELQAASPGMSRAEAIDNACQMNPQLVHEYENGD